MSDEQNWKKYGRPLRKVYPKMGTESKTVESEAQACDINLMMKRYQKHGIIIPGRDGAFYADFTNADDYLAARATIDRGEKGFATLPSAVRERFKHDPAELIDWVGNGDNRAEAIELGLLPTPEPEPQPAPIPPAVADPEPG